MKIAVQQLLLDITEKKGLAKVADTPGQNFFCRACLTDKPAGEQSSDSRYCFFCYLLLRKEAELLPPGRYPKWVPVAPVGGAAQRTATPLHGQNSAPSQNTPAVEKGVLSTSNANGRPRLDLPEDKIRELATTGLGPKEIAAILCDRGIPVSGRTIKRMLLTFASVGKTEGD